MKTQVERLMKEACRRFVRFHRGELLAGAWVGLGTEAYYRPAIDAGLMVFHDGRNPPKRCSGWLVLTEAGQKVVLSMLAHYAEKEVLQTTERSL